MAGRSPTVELKPDLVRWARESAGLPLEVVAKRANIKPDVLELWEHQIARPTARQLERLADAVKRPVATFFLPTPPAEPPAPADFRTLPDKLKAELSPKVRLAARRARRLQQIAAELLATNPEHPAMLPQARLSQDAEGLAERVRALLDVPVQEQFDWPAYSLALRLWRQAIEKQGVFVFQFSMPLEEVRGFSLADGPVPVIVLNSKDALTARMFTLFHEFAHVLLREPALCNPDERHADKATAEVERFCNGVAGAVLVPQDALRANAHLDNLGMDELNRLGRLFYVSPYVIARRLLSCQAITNARHSRLVKELDEESERRGPTKGGGRSLPHEKTVAQLGRTFVSLVLDARERGAITESDACGYLSVRMKYLDQLHPLLAA